jgi:hypothetical protein
MNIKDKRGNQQQPPFFVCPPWSRLTRSAACGPPALRAVLAAGLGVTVSSGIALADLSEECPKALLTNLGEDFANIGTGLCTSLEEEKAAFLRICLGF